MSASLSASGLIGYRDDDGWRTHRSVDRDFSLEPVEFRAQLGAEAALEVGLGTALYDAAKVTFILSPYLHTIADSERTPFWTLTGGIRASVDYSVQIPIVDITLGSHEEELFDMSWELATSDDFPDSAPNLPEPPAVRITSPEDGDVVGCCDVLLRPDLHIPTDDTFHITDWTSSVDGSLGTTENVIPLRATLTPGTHEITAELTARNEEGDDVTVTDTVTIEVRSDRIPGQLQLTESVDGDADGALTLAQALSGTDAPITGAEFLHAPPTGGFAGVVETPPGFPERTEVEGPRGTTAFFDNRAALITTGLAATAVETASTPPVGDDLGGDLVRGGSDRDVTALAVHLDVPEHASCAVLDHRFLSDEIDRYIGTQYNDALVIERFDHTVADDGSVTLDDDGRWTVSNSEITSPLNVAVGPEGLPIRVNAATSAFVAPSNALETSYAEGYPRMRAALPLTPGETQTIVISLFDQGDASYDSAVILDQLRVLSLQEPDDCTGGIAPGGLSLSPGRCEVGALLGAAGVSAARSGPGGVRPAPA